MSDSNTRTSGTPPPPYNEAGDALLSMELKKCFSTLAADQENIQQLFRSVAVNLATTEQIGEHHPIYEEWDTLRQRHRRVTRDSQHNAGRCATFLENYLQIIVPMSQSSMNPEDKEFMIAKFLEAIKVYEEQAETITANFHKLGEEIDGFRLKVASELRRQAEPTGFLNTLWTGIEELCMSIWQALSRTLQNIANTFKAMLSSITSIRLSCGPVHVDFNFSRLPSENHEMTPRETAAHINDDCKDIVRRLTVFEEAWVAVRESCSFLLVSINFAHQLSHITEASEANRKSARVVYAPLKECLRAYALNKPPEL